MSACLHPSRGLSALEVQLKLTLMLSKLIMYKLISILSLSSLSLVKAGTPFLYLHFLLPKAETVGKAECEDTFQPTSIILLVFFCLAVFKEQRVENSFFSVLSCFDFCQ